MVREMVVPTAARSLLCLLALLSPAALAAPAPRRPPALRIEEGSVARRQVVAIGRDLEVAGQALGDVAAVGGEVRISGEVTGDVIVLDGGAHLGPAARVGGDVFVLGGALETAPGAAIAGRAVAYPEASSAYLALLELPTLGQSAGSPLVLGAKVALLTAWLALVLVFFATGGRRVLATSESVRAEPFRCFAVGLVGVLALFLTALFFSLFAAELVGVPLLVLVVLFAVVVKLWGMVAVFHALGEGLARRLLRRRLAPLNAAVVGLLLLGAFKLLPWVGLAAWHVATFIGVGAALTTKLGRREPWFDLAPHPAPTP
jgi:hypothetical protein